MQKKERKEYKSPWRFLFLFLAVLSSGYLALHRMLTSGWLLNRLMFNEAATIGIIGGADGPTAIFVTRSAGFDWDILLVVAVLVVSVFAYFRLRKCKEKS